MKNLSIFLIFTIIFFSCFFVPSQTYAYAPALLLSSPAVGTLANIIVGLVAAGATGYVGKNVANIIADHAPAIYHNLSNSSRAFFNDLVDSLNIGFNDSKMYLLNLTTSFFDDLINCTVDSIGHSLTLSGDSIAIGDWVYPGTYNDMFAYDNYPVFKEVNKNRYYRVYVENNKVWMDVRSGTTRINYFNMSTSPYNVTPNTSISSIIARYNTYQHEQHDEPYPFLIPHVVPQEPILTGSNVLSGLAKNSSINNGVVSVTVPSPQKLFDGTTEFFDSPTVSISNGYVNYHTTFGDSYMNPSHSDYISIDNIRIREYGDSISLDWSHVADLYRVYEISSSGVLDLVATLTIPEMWLDISSVEIPTTWKIEGYTSGELTHVGEITYPLDYVYDPSIPGNEVGWLSRISSSLTNFFDLSRPIDWSPLQMSGEVFTRKFPFSLPWDLSDSIQAFKYTGSTPNFSVNLGGLMGNTKLDIDFTMFDSILPYVRVLEVVLFDISLILITRRILGGAS